MYVLIVNFEEISFLFCKMGKKLNREEIFFGADICDYILSKLLSTIKKRVILVENRVLCILSLTWCVGQKIRRITVVGATVIVKFMSHFITVTAAVPTTPIIQTRRQKMMCQDIRSPSTPHRIELRTDSTEETVNCKKPLIQSCQPVPKARRRLVPAINEKRKKI